MASRVTTIVRARITNSFGTLPAKSELVINLPSSCPYVAIAAVYFCLYFRSARNFPIPQPTAPETPAPC